MGERTGAAENDRHQPTSRLSRGSAVVGSFVLGAVAGTGLATIAAWLIGDRFGILVLATLGFITMAALLIRDGRHRAFGLGVLSVFLAAALFLLGLLILGIGMSSGGDEDGDVQGTPHADSPAW